MSRRAIGVCSITLLVATSVAAPTSAQTATVSGTVTDTVTGAPIGDARIQLKGGGTPLRTLTTDTAGTFRISGIPAGRYAIVVSRIGYRAFRLDTLDVATGEMLELTIALQPQALQVDPLVWSASRTVERALDAPASVSVVDTRDVRENAALTPVDHVTAVPAVDVSTTGLTQHEVVVRGFNNVASGALLVLTDNRYASLPSLRINTFNFIPATNDDMERIELVRGPGSALYGPNSANGVMHILTQSPFDSPGAVATVTGGERELFQTSLRWADRLSDRVALKVSGQYLRGTEWPHTDADEEVARQQAIAGGADPDTLLIGLRDPTIERYAAEVRIDWRPDAQTSVATSVGSNNAVRNVDLTPLGAVQVRDWRYSYAQARFTRGPLFAQLFVNASSADDTYFLLDGRGVVDKSVMLVAQAQHGVTLGRRGALRYGVDLQRTVPRTDGTITGRNEDDDTINEAGVYAHAEAQLSPLLQVVAAARIDYHDRLENLVFSPRAALVFKPQPEHTLRATYNRAFGTPTTNNLFLDLVARELRDDFTGFVLPFVVRFHGVPETGFSFRRDCAGGLCMRSPFTPASQGGPQAFIPVDVTLLWDGIIDTLATLGLDLSAIPPPTSSQVGTNLLLLDLVGGAAPVTDAIDIPPLVPTITNTLEVGYKGVIGNRLVVAVDLHRTWKNDFVGPARIETPSAFFEPTSLAAYLCTFIPCDSAAAIAAIAAPIPVGTVTPVEARDPWDVIVTYRNFGDIALWGADIDVTAVMTDDLSVRGTYSWLSDDFFPAVSGIANIALNASANKGSLSVLYRNNGAGWFAEGRVRAVAGFPVNSGIYIGDVESFAVVDASVGYRLPLAPHITISVHGTNIFDNDHAEFLGAPEIGRLVLAKVRAEF